MAADDKLIYKGAEANLYRTSDGILKKRVGKKYRISELDTHLRKTRTRREAKILEKLGQAGLPVPKVIDSSEKEFTILMEDLRGETVKDAIDSSSPAEAAELARKIGGLIRQTHELDVVHNDLTTSNMLSAGGKIYLIDWGLGYHTTRLEDKAMDLVVFRKSMRATHPGKFKIIWAGVIEGYGITKSLSARVDTIEKRVRYA